ncbi:hypothetical protein SynA1544_01787 [Synechococcus sp. A15-44]|nr:hypothetical protein SynA1544_01787 [Synechococcus sp. A15-44]
MSFIPHLREKEIMRRQSHTRCGDAFPWNSPGMNQTDPQANPAHAHR